MLVPPTDPVTGLTIIVPSFVVQTIIRLTRNPGVRACPCGDGWIVVQTRNPCWRCGTPGAAALHQLPYTGDADAVVELCVACVLYLDAVMGDA